MKRRTIIIWGCVSVALAGWAAYQAAAAIVRPDREGAHAIERMSKLTKLEHDRLQRDFREFEKLSPQEQQRLREMHELLQQPGEGAALRQTSETYYRWYSDLEPRRRVQLQHETDVEQKLQLVRQFQEQLEQQAEDGSGGFGRHRRRWSKKLNPQDLAAVMAAIETALREQQPELSAKLDAIPHPPGYRRYHAVMMLLRDDFRAPRSRGGQTAAVLRFLDDPRFVEAITEDDIRRRITAADGKDQDDRRPRNLTLWLLIYVSMEDAYYREIEKDAPTEDELLNMVAQLETDKLDRLMKLPTTKIMPKLKEEFVRDHPERFPPPPQQFLPEGRGWFTRGRNDDRRGPAPNGPRGGRRPQRNP